MIQLKEFKKSVKAVLENNAGQCSICIQDIDSHVLAFANLHGAQTTWGHDALTLFIPKEITFQIPYMEIKDYHVTNSKQIEVELEGRILVSIRELQ